jgi:hypothetical protein
MLWQGGEQSRTLFYTVTLLYIRVYVYAQDHERVFTPYS